MEKLIGILIFIRLVSILLPQISYMYPDEFFQSTEIVAGDVLDVRVERPWEFNSQTPIRSVVFPFLIAGPPLYLLRWLASVNIPLVTPYFVLVLPRFVMALVSLIIDVAVFKLCQTHRINARFGVLLYATSYVTFTYFTRTFSNTVEAVLFAVLLLLTRPDVTSRFTSRRGRSELWKPLAIGAVVSAGIFNRPTFVAFAFVPLFFWAWDKYKSGSFRELLKISLLPFVSACVTGLVFMLLDTYYYSPKVVTGFVTDFKHCMFSNSKVNCLRDVGGRFKLTPLNFFDYNRNPDNLSEHGTHPRYLNILVNLPLLFGPLVVFLYWRIVKNVANVVSGGFVQLQDKFLLNDFRLVSVIVFPLVVLSLFPHQEPRFLTPLIPAGVVLTCRFFKFLKFESVEPPIKIETLEPSKVKNFTLGLWVVFNVLFTILFGFLHQGQLVPALMDMQSHLARAPKTGTNNHLLFFHTYTPPRHFLLQQRAAEEHVFIHDLAGKSVAKLKKLVEELHVSYVKGKDRPAKIWIIAPSSLDVEQDFLKYKLDVTSMCWHLSMEDPPRIGRWWRGKMTLTDLLSDMCLDVIQFKKA
ncbi:GPI mannosyltransferase 4-like [Gigantopelta aegis]|uniref:GPI mannosyltransferase 4-like n=1 Tax=Gigantopelta aegis TaxID=1735272 RepID=UPI001B88DFE9|nr:GPI mannosyltransferase 4-like [Gigantopelta aegis]